MKRIDLVKVGCHEAERQILGTLLMLGEDRTLYDSLNLHPEHFTKASHKLIFQTVGWMLDRSEHVDPLTVMRRLDRKRGALARAGGRVELDRMVSECVPSGVKAHAMILREEHRVRVLQRGLLEASEALERRDLEAVDGVLSGLVSPAAANVVPIRKAAA